MECAHIMRKHVKSNKNVTIQKIVSFFQACASSKADLRGGLFPEKTLSGAHTVSISRVDTQSIMLTHTPSVCILENYENCLVADAFSNEMDNDDDAVIPDVIHDGDELWKWNTVLYNGDGVGSFKPWLEQDCKHFVFPIPTSWTTCIGL